MTLNSYFTLNSGYPVWYNSTCCLITSWCAWGRGAPIYIARALGPSLPCAAVTHVLFHISFFTHTTVTITLAPAMNNDNGSIIASDHVMYLSALNMRSDWFFLVLITFWQMIQCAVLRQRPTRKRCCGSARANTMPCKNYIRIEIYSGIALFSLQQHGFLVISHVILSVQFKT